MPNLNDGYKPRSVGFRKISYDDWYPTRADMTVGVRVVELVDSKGEIDMVRVCVWGEDDTGMEYDFPLSVMTFEMACLIGKSLPEPITKEGLTKLGFVYA